VNTTKIDRFAELKSRLWFLLLALIVYRLGTHIPVPGIDSNQLEQLFNQNKGGILDLFNMFSGGALSRFSIFALGITPYISASIIIQLSSAIIPVLEDMKKEGESGKKKMTQYTRYLTLVLGTFQAFGIAVFLESQLGLVITPGTWFKIITILTLMTGTMFLMWLGEQITERGLGNGISIIIFSGIVAGLPIAVSSTAKMISSGSLLPIVSILLLFLIVAVTTFVVLMERAQRKITINYAKRQVGNKIYGGQSSHLPFKLNIAGVIPPIFASSIILFPATIADFFSANENLRWLKDIANALRHGEPLYMFLYAIMIIFFCFFYTALIHNSKEVADNLKRSGAFIPGIRPGENTANYMDKVLVRLTLAGSLYLVLVCLIPDLLSVKLKVPFYFGGTSLLIIVVVSMDFWAQVQNFILNQQYEPQLKKYNFKPQI
jgi:preprotein translocase subunit SecY